MARSFPLILFHKPIGYTTEKKSGDVPSIFDLLDEHHFLGEEMPKTSSFTVTSELDADSEGLVLLTSDPHVRQNEREVYEVFIASYLTRDAEDVLTHGMMVDSIFIQPVAIEKTFHKGKQDRLTIETDRDRSKDIRAMLARLGFSVISIKRTKIGTQSLGVLPVGRWTLSR